MLIMSELKQTTALCLLQGEASAAEVEQGYMACNILLQLTVCKGNEYPAC